MICVEKGAVGGFPVFMIALTYHFISFIHLFFTLIFFSVHSMQIAQCYLLSDSELNVDNGSGKADAITVGWFGFGDSSKFYIFIASLVCFEVIAALQSIAKNREQCFAVQTIGFSVYISKNHNNGI